MAATHLFEIVSRRAENAKHWQMSDGSIQANFYVKPIHYSDENGMWQNIDHLLHDASDFDIFNFPVSKEIKDVFYQKKQEAASHKKQGSIDRLKQDFHALKVPFHNRIPRYFSRGYEIGKDGEVWTFMPVGTSTSLGHIDPTSPHKIEYADVWNDTDVTLEIQDTKIKETIILKSASAPTVFSFQVVGGINDDLTSTGGGLALVPAWLVDAAGTKRDVQQTIRRENGNDYIELTADVSGLQFPVYIDPTATYTYNSAGATFASVESSFPNSTLGGFQAGKNSSTPSGVYRGFAKWDVSGIPAGAHVTSANIQNAWASIQTGGTNAYHFYKCTSSWNTSMTWNSGQPTWDTNTGTGFTVSSSSTYSYTQDIMSIAQAWVNGPNYGMAFVSDNEGTIYNVSWDTGNYSVTGTTNTSWPLVTINYTSPPTAPTVTSPNGGELVNTTYNITWTAATDPDTAQSSLTYQIDLSRDNGATWANIVNTTAAGAASYTYDFSNVAATTQALIRIRAYDGASYGPYDQSNSIFTIDHSPTAPTNLSPNSGTAQDRAQAITVTWQFTDPDSGNTQSKFDIKYSTNGGSTWTETDGIVSTQAQYTFAANTFPHGNVLWAVRTYDQNNLVSPWSAQATFLAADKPTTPTITSPSTIGVANPTITWSSSGQVGYEFQLRDSNNNVIWDDTQATSTSQSELETNTSLTNGSTYIFAVRIKNSDGIWSDYATQTVTVSYTPPATPVVTITPYNAGSYMTVNISNPAPTGTQPNVTSNDVYRRIVGSTSWARIATNISSNGSFKDFAVASGIPYEYKATAHGDNLTVCDSTINSNNIISLTGIWVHDPTNPTGTVMNLPYNDNRAEMWAPESTAMKFAGRSRPVVEFGQQEDYEFNVNVSLTTDQALWSTLSNLIRSKKALCFRDFRGRKVFGVVQSLPETDTFYGQDISLKVTEIDYSEAV